jgi:hypothetical protein
MLKMDNFYIERFCINVTVQSIYAISFSFVRSIEFKYPYVHWHRVESQKQLENWKCNLLFQWIIYTKSKEIDIKLSCHIFHILILIYNIIYRVIVYIYPPMVKS